MMQHDAKPESAKPESSEVHDDEEEDQGHEEEAEAILHKSLSVQLLPFAEIRAFVKYCLSPRDLRQQLILLTVFLPNISEHEL